MYPNSEGIFNMLFEEWLKDDSKTILFDGAMGTEIFKRGVKPGTLPDVINIEQPVIIVEIFKAYYDAGSDMCQTCTFSSSKISLHKHDLEENIKQINEAAIKNLKAACPPGRLLVGDIGPSGEFRPPIGNASYEQWHSSFKSQVEILEQGVDLWHIETMSDIEEMVAAIRAVKEVSKKPIISSMTYKKTKKGHFTIMGDSLEKCISAMEREKVDVIGSNCSLGSSDMIDVVKEMKNYTDKPLSAKPNAGLPRVIDVGKTVYDQPVQDFVKDIKQMIDLGVKIVGGCCGTTPETIKEIRKLIDSSL
jgi:5-methyltetrahydrofolate--homocysteine methyltransferase